MPTHEQLDILRESEKYFGSNSPEDGYNVKGSAMAGSGLHKPPMEFTGKTIGTISIDPKTKDIVIKPDTSTEESGE